MQCLFQVICIFADELQRIQNVKFVLKKIEETSLEYEEKNFWEETLKKTLRPVPEEAMQATELKRGLNNLRNSTMVAVFLFNLIWIVLFLTLTFTELEALNINSEVLIIVLLGVYGLILVIQFVMMVIHRFITLTHYIARLDL